MRKHLILLSVISAFAFTGLRAQEYRIKSAGCSSNGDYLIETIVSSPHALSKNEAKVLLRRCAVTGLLFQGAEATACYAACPAAFKQGEPRRTRWQHLKERFAERHCGACITNHCTQKPEKKPIRIFHANCNKHEPTAPPCSFARFAVVLHIFQERASKSSWVYGQ